MIAGNVARRGRVGSQAQTCEECTDLDKDLLATERRNMTAREPVDAGLSPVLPQPLRMLGRNDAVPQPRHDQHSIGRQS